MELRAVPTDFEPSRPVVLPSASPALGGLGVLPLVPSRGTVPPAWLVPNSSSELSAEASGASDSTAARRRRVARRRLARRSTPSSARAPMTMIPADAASTAPLLESAPRSATGASTECETL